MTDQAQCLIPTQQQLPTIMDRFDRILTLHKIMSGRRTPIPRNDLIDRLECSRATLSRMVKDYRDIGAPLIHDREHDGYVLDQSEDAPWELPGLWFNPSEILALLTSQQLLSRVQPGILTPVLAPLQQRLETLLETRQGGGEEIGKRIRILPLAQRETRLEFFQQIADALVSRVQIRILYHGRARDKTSERWVSPQRLIYYRDNWYMDGWCHKQKGLRIFSLDRINVMEKGETAIDIPDDELNEHFTSGFGIFAGAIKGRAVIRFSGHAARWVADEEWHPDQESRLHGTDGWELVVPYSDPRELVMDILKYGPDAEVVEPAELREMVVERLGQALTKYEGGK